MSFNIEKELPEISLHITEPEYRARPELSYSTISTYESLGFNGLDHLFDKKESPSLVFGSIVDTLITGSIDEFNDRFLIVDGTVTDGGKLVCQQLASMNLPYATFSEIPQQVVSDAAKEAGFWKADKWNSRRYSEVLKSGNVEGYYQACIHQDKTPITSEDYVDAQNCVAALRNSSATSGLFAENDPLSPIRRYYQLKFNAIVDGVGYRNMLDLVIVDYEDKIVYPYDLKTSSPMEWDFEENFMKYHYYQQARLYRTLLKLNMDHDPYFKDFKLDPFRFIVINRKSLTPLVWEFPTMNPFNTLVDKNNKEYRSPFDLGKELQGYLDNRPQVPNGINKDGVNVLKCLKEKPPIVFNPLGL